ncbi:hypothetical protein CDAR_280931 [Caerostris darwini]|uniref:Uncharacterized protein n=1 Tax=Caerostris darwini TaxID=1538125 RepID=A0AAV4VTZ1_9ARAC|nr:hypothetical protein CDAR_280931 [Caerostris darwini]
MSTFYVIYMFQTLDSFFCNYNDKRDSRSGQAKQLAYWRVNNTDIGLMYAKIFPKHLCILSKKSQKISTGNRIIDARHLTYVVIVSIKTPCI